MEDPTPTSAVSDNYLHEGCQLYCPLGEDGDRAIFITIDIVCGHHH